MNSLNFQTHALPFENQLGIAFDKILDYIENGGNGNWTKAVKKIMDFEVRTLRPNLKVAASKLDTSNCTEWLYDFVCYEENSIGLKDVILVAESEWRNPFTHDSLQDIQDDFEKLILARAYYKLMIFEGDKLEEIEKIISHLVTIIKNCDLTKIGDRYMFAGWIKSKEFYYDLYIQN